MKTAPFNGVVCEDGTKIGAKVVVLATGGFGSNPDMIKQFRPDLDGYVSTNAQSIQGDGMVMAQKAGASPGEHGPDPDPPHGFC